MARTELRVTDTIDGEEVSAHPDVRGWANNLPVVIVPGFCSSGLKVVRSDENPEWAGERVRWSMSERMRE